MLCEETQLLDQVRNLAVTLGAPRAPPASHSPPSPVTSTWALSPQTPFPFALQQLRAAPGRQPAGRPLQIQNSPCGHSGMGTQGVPYIGTPWATLTSDLPGLPGGFRVGPRCHEKILCPLTSTRLCASCGLHLPVPLGATAPCPLTSRTSARCSLAQPRAFLPSPCYPSSGFVSGVGSSGEALPDPQPG